MSAHRTNSTSRWGTMGPTHILQEVSTSLSSLSLVSYLFVWYLPLFWDVFSIDFHFVCSGHLNFLFEEHSNHLFFFFNLNLSLKVVKIIVCIVMGTTASPHTPMGVSIGLHADRGRIHFSPCCLPNYWTDSRFQNGI